MGHLIYITADMHKNLSAENVHTPILLHLPHIPLIYLHLIINFNLYLDLQNQNYFPFANFYHKIAT